MISAGRVLLMPKGDYDPTTTYEMLDIVSYNGSSYIAKSTTIGNLPTNTTYWQLSAYGGQAANLAGNFAPLETTEYASRAYAIDDIFVDKDSQLVIATTTINIGDEIEIGSNCDATTMAELLDAIENRYDALDQRNRKLVGINPITIQTDLHLLAPGEYFKKLTNFYVTNAPTGINQVPAAIFRLTVESGLDESGSSLLLTLRTIEGEIYTQAYDGSVWSDWRKAGDVDSSDLGTAAAKDSTNEVTSDSTDLVESGAVYTEIQTLTNQVKDMNNVLGAKNILPDNYKTQTLGNTVEITALGEGAFKVNGTANATGNYQVLPAWNYSTNAFKKYVGKEVILSATNSDIVPVGVFLVDSNNSTLVNLNTWGNEKKTVLDGSVKYSVYIQLTSGTTYDNVIVRPMIRLASIQDDTYVPYSMTNQEITPYVQAISNPNLLDNPWFTVNQRGESSYTQETSYAYTVDRWQMYNMALSVLSDGITLTPNASTLCVFSQSIENFDELIGKTVTISAVINGQLYSATGIFPSKPSSGENKISVSFGLNRLQLTFNASNSYPKFEIVTYDTTAISIKAVKLELGSVSTLAMDTAPNYATELLKCQRYFNAIKTSSSQNDWFAIGLAVSGSADFVLNVPPMRTVPTVTYNNLSVSDGRVPVKAITAVRTIHADINNQAIHFPVNYDNSSPYSESTLPVGLRGEAGGNSYIYLSADL